MPGGDASGPMGMGPRTGRGMGYCSGYDTPGYANGIPRGGGGFGGMGFGRGGGRGFRHRYYATGMTGYARAGYGMGGWGWRQDQYYGGEAPQISRENELNMLKVESERLTETIESIKKRMVELEKKDDKK